MAVRQETNIAQTWSTAAVIALWTLFTVVGWLVFRLTGEIPLRELRLAVSLAVAASLGVLQGLVLRKAGAQGSLFVWGSLSAGAAGIAAAAGALRLDPFLQGWLWAALLGLGQAVLLRRTWFYGGWWSLAYWPGFIISWVTGWPDFVLCAINSALLLGWLLNINFDKG